MARRMTPAQLKSKLRQLENQQKQSIQKINKAINDYNREVKTYNARVQRNRQQIKNALTRLQRASVTQTHVVFRTSTYTLNEAYVRLEEQNDYNEDDPRYRLMLELPQQENANSLAVANALLTGEIDADEQDSDLQSTSITDQLSNISSDLNLRWHGALFSLNPGNPDAARHFCTSAREIFTQILHTKAPDASVFALMPGCEIDAKGQPTRRSRIRYLLYNKGLVDAILEDFIDSDISNIIELFKFFNEGTHSVAGKFDLRHLLTVKRRVEDAIIYVTSIIG